ncbi:restriction endonuclease subunit S [[Clostridium] hylemonae]|uniref:restriction endonuclease subunit S n=1 Tax=[Clostridium] hylemonae TaxID=89153 RepID=UPI001D06A611|nr:restriction endonuclease subunit S [[Clostridium] hylemonae]MCB7520782.1 restriction endonuclease subunit S [[Clostridium] hylemonae]
MVDFKEFKLDQVLNWQTQIEIDPLKLKDLAIDNEPKYPFYGQSTTNNGIIGYYHLNSSVLNNKKSLPTILIHSNNQNIVYVDTPFYLKDGHGATSVLQSDFLSAKSALYIMTSIRKAIENRFTYNAKATKIALKNTKIVLPVTKKCKIDYNYMEDYIISLEQDGLGDLTGYLKANGLSNSDLTKEEQSAIGKFNKNQLNWQTYNVEQLFGKSTRGKRLKSFDRIDGKLPFVTAGEANAGISAYIGNCVEIFLNNTTTIDMFGSAKYRNYNYGADDHIAVVHTEKLPKYAAMFIAACLHKSSHAGQFDYSRNFYAKNADALYISLPTKNDEPDYHFMETYMKAIEKLVLKDVIDWKDKIL